MDMVLLTIVAAPIGPCLVVAVRVSSSKSIGADVNKPMVLVGVPLESLWRKAWDRSSDDTPWPR